MASKTLTSLGDRWVDGTTLGIYPKSNFNSANPPTPGLAPVGSATASGTLTAGAITFAGLADNTEYVVTDAAGSKYVRVSTWQDLHGAAGATLKAELGYAEIITPSSNFTATADLTIPAAPGTPALTVTFTAGTRPVIAKVESYSLQQGAAAGVATLYITDSANNQLLLATGGSVAANAFSASVSKSVRLNTLTPGTSYTYKVRASATAAAAAMAGAGYPTSLHVFEI